MYTIPDHESVKTLQTKKIKNCSTTKFNQINGY